MAQTVVLTVGLSAYTGKAVAVHNALESLTLGCSDDVYISYVLGEDVGYGENVTELELSCEVSLELNELALGSGSCLLEVPHERSAGVLFSGFVIGKLYSGITVGFHCTELRNYARTSLDNGAWYILAIGTEHGSHSDFLSN